MKITKYSEKINIAVFLILFIIIFQVFAQCSVQKELSEMKLHMSELVKVKDGTYLGIYDSKMVKAQVAVELKDQSIKDIELIKHETGLGKKAETLVDSVIQYQTIELDAFAGATLSSKVILKSIESALIKSIN
jgi:uncharacterized protein with FMN-binding domain